MVTAATSPRELPGFWRAEVALLRRRGATEVAAALESCADDLEAALRDEAGAVVSLAEAARISGYSADHLGRMIRASQLVNLGTRGRPLVRVADLPRKPGMVHDRGARRAAAEVVALHSRGTT